MMSHRHRHRRKYVPVLIAALVSLALLLAVVFIPQMLRDRKPSPGGTQESRPPAYSPSQTLQADDPVPRSYFVYMVGYRSENARTDSIPDLSADDPAWDMLIHSPLRLRDGQLCPDAIITYTEAAVYLYDSIGGKMESYAPGFLTDDPAIGWAYEHGLIEMNERLTLVQNNKEITVAEAETMIAKAREEASVNFCDSVSDELLARVLDGSAFFDRDYASMDSITNGELAHAANRLRTEKIQAIFYVDKADFTHPYADDLKAMEPALGKGRISAEFANKPVTVRDAVAMLSFAMASKNHQFLAYGEITDNYSDTPTDNTDMNKALSFAWRSGIRLRGAALGTEPASKREIASILLQYDMSYGLLSSVTVDGTDTTYADESIKKFDLPASTDLYQAIPDSVPSEIADLAFRNTSGDEISLTVKPYENYAFCNDLRDEFAKALSSICQQIRSESGAEVKITYYPQLVYDNRSNGEHVRVKVEVTHAEPGTDLSKYFGTHIYPENTAIESGTVFWADVHLDYTFFA